MEHSVNSINRIRLGPRSNPILLETLNKSDSVYKIKFRLLNIKKKLKVPMEHYVSAHNKLIPFYFSNKVKSLLSL